MDLLVDPFSWDMAFNNGPLTGQFTTQPLTQTVAQRLKTLDKVFPNSKDNHFGVNYLVLDENLPVGVKTRDYLKLKCTICNHEFSQRANSVFLGVISCKCSKSFRRSKEDYLSDISMVGNASGFSVKNVSYSKPLGESRIELCCDTCNKSWTTSFTNILNKGSGCIYCSGHYQPSRQEYIDLIDQRLSDKFKLISVESIGEINKSTKITVKCEKCNGFSTKTVSAVMYQTPSCPCCANWGFDPSVENTLYLIKLSDSKNFFYKIGITCNTKRRFRELSRDNKMDVDVIITWTYPPFTQILQHESYLKDNFAMGRSYEKPFNDGYTEVVSTESLPILISVQNLQYRGISSGLTSRL